MELIGYREPSNEFVLSNGYLQRMDRSTARLLIVRPSTGFTFEYDVLRCEWSAVKCLAEPVMMTASFKFKTQSEMDSAIKVLGKLAGFVCNAAASPEPDISNIKNPHEAMRYLLDDFLTGKHKIGAPAEDLYCTIRLISRGRDELLFTRQDY